MPPNAGTRTSTRQGRATVRPTNYYARSFAGRLAANGMEHTPEASNAAPGFLPALTHFTGAVDSFPKEMIRQFSMFKEVEAKLHDPEQLLKDLLEEISQVPITTKAQRRKEQSNRSAENGANTSQSFENLSPSEQADVKRRQLFFRLRMLITHMIPILDEKLVVLQSTKAIKDKGLMRMHHSYSQLDNEISDEARYGSLTHWAYADKEEKKKGAATHERQRREVVAANNLAAAAQHVHDVDSIAAKSEARREAMLANKRSRHQQIDSDFDDRPAKRPQKKKALAADAPPPDGRNLGLGISNGAGPNGGKRKKTEKALAAASLAAPAMERSLSGAMRTAGNSGGRAGSSPRATPGPEGNTAAKRKPRAAPAPTQRKTHLAPQSPTLASSPLAANFAINKAIGGPADRPLSARARKNSIANSTTSASAQETSVGRRPSTSHSVHPPPGSNAITELEQAAGISREMEPVQDVAMPQGVIDAPQLMETTAMKQEENEQFEPTPNALELPMQAAYAARTGRTSKTATPIVGAFPEVPMARSRSTRNANNGNSNSNPSSENNSTTTGSVSKRNTKKTTQAVSAALASPALKATPTSKSNPPSTASSVAPDLEADYAEADSEVDSDEPRYCYCNQVSYGNMVACDNDDCPREWFHLPCVNLDKAPIGRTKWFCSDDCEEVYRKTKSKAKGGRPGSSRQ